MAMTIPSARAVGAFGRVAGMREARKARCGEGPAPCPGPQVLFFSRGERGEQAASPLACGCGMSPRSAWISLTRTTSCGACASFQGSAARPWNPAVQCEKARPAPVPSRAHTHRQSVGGANCRARSIVRLWEPGFLVLQPRACLGFPFLFDMAPYVELARAGARRTDFTLPSLGAHRPTLGQGLYWKVDLWAMEAQFDDPSRVQSAPIQSHRWSATAVGTPLWSEWSSCSFRTLLVTPAPLTPTMQQLRENSVSKGPEAVGPGSTRFPTTSRPGSRPVLARQHSRVPLTWLGLSKDRQGTPESCMLGRHAAA